jgi:polyisoprenoid-binding protein YceI
MLAGRANTGFSKLNDHESVAKQKGRMKYFYIVTTVALVCISLYLSAFMKSGFNMEQSIFNVSGKCTMKNWTFISKDAKGDGDFEISDNLIKEIRSLKLSIPAKSLRSDNKSMNNHAWDALKSDLHPTITFVLSKVEKIVPENNAVQVTALGNLTVAGVTKPVVLSAKGTVIGDKVSFDGTYRTRMTDFNIDPPTFALGGIKSQNDVTVSFQATFKQ